MTLLGCILAFIFVGLAALHLYWAAGGNWAAKVALPKLPDGRLIFRPNAFASAAVALGLGAFGYICLVHLSLVPPLFLVGRTRVILFVISGVFALRTIGDFNYVGIFRRVNSTDFSRMDRICYTPLCLSLSASLLWLAVGI